MGKYRFVIVGSGWRSLYYVRIAKALPEVFELGAMLCRTEEKASRMRTEYNINAIVDEKECEDLKPDFVVVVVNKASIAEVSAKWMEKGFTVLCETPAAIEQEALEKLWDLKNKGCKLVVAEQYTHYPSFSSLIKVVKKRLIGEPDYMMISLAHGYHGISLMRALLELEQGEQYSVISKTHEFPTVETLSRYERFTDGRTSDKKRTIAKFEFKNGKVALFDFDSEQYRSPIRNNFVKIQGERGEIMGNDVYFLDENNNPVTKSLVIENREVRTDYDNPNLNVIREITGIYFGDEKLYEPPFGLVGLAEDETAIALMMQETAEYSRGTGKEPYSLKEALQDAYGSMLMERAESQETVVYTEKQNWN